MEKHEHVFERFIDFENLYGGYLLARKNKRYKNDVLEYTANLEENLINAQNHLIWKTYTVDGLREFIEYYPKKRIITVMPFKNRVVNCAAYNVLYPCADCIPVGVQYLTCGGEAARKPMLLAVFERPLLPLT